MERMLVPRLYGCRCCERKFLHLLLCFRGGGGVQDLGRCIASGSFLESQSVLACFHQNRAEPAPCLAHRRFSEAISFFESVFQRSNHR